MSSQKYLCSDCKREWRGGQHKNGCGGREFLEVELTRSNLGRKNREPNKMLFLTGSILIKNNQTNEQDINKCLL